jgi:hypothetical protein
MKKLLLFTAAVLAIHSLFAQNCSELFISEYVEGYGNNRALELYNPTKNRIDLSKYSVGRFSNGSTEYTGIQIPAGNFIEPYGTFTIVLDKRDSLGVSFEVPVWNGYPVWAVCIDRVTMLPIIDTNGDTVYCVQYDDTGRPLYGSIYRDFLDLQGKADVFLCPVYNVNNAMYFNGNDAVALVKGADLLPDGSNLLDVIGVIGEDPDVSIGQPAWVDGKGTWLTSNKTLVRTRTVKKGTGIVAAFARDTFNYSQWTVFSNNTFVHLGDHDCECDLSSVAEPVQTTVRLSPNPASDFLVVEASQAVERVVIFDQLGRRQHDFPFGKNALRQTLDISALPSGLYIVSLDLGVAGKSIRKLVKR